MGQRNANWWINALLPSTIWLGATAFYAYLKKPAGGSVLDVRTDATGWLGAGLLGAGFALHCWSAVVLAGHLSESGQTATLAVTGPYRFVRSPIYLAGISLLAGIGLLYGPWHFTDLVLPRAVRAFSSGGDSRRRACTPQPVWLELQRLLSSRVPVVPRLAR
jgi:protein-S-isoprenylcysteine O-methyltransferase Ste14